MATSLLGALYHYFKSWELVLGWSGENPEYTMTKQRKTVADGIPTWFPPPLPPQPNLTPTAKKKLWLQLFHTTLWSSTSSFFRKLDKSCRLSNVSLHSSAEFPLPHFLTSLYHLLIPTSIQFSNRQNRRHFRCSWRKRNWVGVEPLTTCGQQFYRKEKDHYGRRWLKSCSTRLFLQWFLGGNIVYKQIYSNYFYMDNFDRRWGESGLSWSYYGQYPIQM